MSRIAYSLPEAAKEVGVSVDVLRQAIHATDPNSFPPPLKAKRKGTEKKFSYSVAHAELERWHAALPDA